MTKPTEIELHVGHYGDRTGASGYVDEVQFARKFIKRIYDILVANKVPATYYEDIVSKNQTQNINNLIAHHNADRNGLIVSGHLNASGSLTERPIGVEVLYTTKKDLAAAVAKAMSDASGLINRGAKYRDNIGVFTKTYEPSISIEFGFVNSKKDVELLDKHFEAICQAVAKELAAAIGHKITGNKKEESTVSQVLLNETGRAEAKGLIKKAVAAGIFEKSHLDKLDKYSDVELISYSVAYVNRTTK
ncbi:N-acetylmuramoyl-L-alanine amidase [Solibacillus cecembensis]|uniref:N-acetylmuramoyl-L-alanine amidase n=1 Tax=Solibacillus cecembensis TaxID=459347 RepID=UPI003D0842C8